MVGLLAPPAGIGLLYLLRAAHLANAGPLVHWALPLESLAGADAQPFWRVALACVPVGLAAGALLAGLARGAQLVSFLLATLVAGALLVVNVGVSVSIENNESLHRHLRRGLQTAGPWVELALLVIGAAVAVAVSAARRPAPSGR